MKDLRVSKSYLFLSVIVCSGLLIFSGFSLFSNSNNFSDYSIPIPGSDVELDMVAVEGGSFLMGSPQDESGRNENEGPRREVVVDSFWMGKYEVTWSQYDLFVNEVIDNLKEELASGAGRNIEIGADALSTPTAPYVDMTFGMGRDGYPAISMTHYAAVMFAKWLTAKTGDFYRLPTEAEWEYACRAGTETAYHFGDSEDDIDRYVWHRENSDRSYNRVGTKEPNGFGLYDMSGNLSEWTMDQYFDDYFERLDDASVTNPWFRPTELYPRSVRGGSWMDGVEDQRCATRRGSDERWKMLDPQMPKSLWWHTSAQFVGFRLVRPENPPSPEVIENYWIEEMQDF